MNNTIHGLTIRELVTTQTAQTLTPNRRKIVIYKKFQTYSLNNINVSIRNLYFIHDQGPNFKAYF